MTSGAAVTGVSQPRHADAAAVVHVSAGERRQLVRGVLYTSCHVVPRHDWPQSPEQQTRRELYALTRSNEIALDPNQDKFGRAVTTPDVSRCGVLRVARG